MAIQKKRRRGRPTNAEIAARAAREGKTVKRGRRPGRKPKDQFDSINLSAKIGKGEINFSVTTGDGGNLNLRSVEAVTTLRTFLNGLDI